MRTWLADARGAESVEYSALVGLVAILLAAALATLGPPLMASYEASRHVVNSPYP